MLNLRQITDLRAISPDIAVVAPKVGIGLNFSLVPFDTAWPSAMDKVLLKSDHISGNCYIPVTNGSGDNLTLEFTPGAGMTVDLEAGLETGAGKLDQGTVAAGTFYDFRIISKRGSSAAILAHKSGRLEPGTVHKIVGATAANPTVITTDGIHSLSNGDTVTIQDSTVSGLNDSHTVANATSTTFEVDYNNGGGDTTPDGTAFGGAFQMPVGYTHYSDVCFGCSYTGPGLAFFVFSGVPADGCTLTLESNEASAVTKVFEVDDDGSGVTGSNIAIGVSQIVSATDASPSVITTAGPHGLSNGNDVTIQGASTALNGSYTVADAASTTFSVLFDNSGLSTTPGGEVLNPATFNASGFATALVNAITTADFGITAIPAGPGVVLLFQNVTASGIGAGTGETTIAKTGDWDAATAINIPSAFVSFGIVPFVQTGPGALLYGTGCMYSTGSPWVSAGTENSKVGKGGPQVLLDGAQVGNYSSSTGLISTSAAVDISKLCPSPVAGTSYQDRGTAILTVEGDNAHATTRVGYIIFSPDGRDTSDTDSMTEVIWRLGRLDNANGAGNQEIQSRIDFPLALEGTTIAIDGNDTDSIGTLENTLHYYWTGAAACKMDIYVAGWRLNG